MTRRAPRTARLDRSDLSSFPRAAEPGEWACSGAFAHGDPEALSGKARLAFGTAWLGVASFGFSTFVEVAEIAEAERVDAIEALVRRFRDAFGAPSDAEARRAAEEVMADAEALAADHKLWTLLAVERSVDDDGRVVERFRAVKPERAPDHAKIWEIAPDD